MNLVAVVILPSNHQLTFRLLASNYVVALHVFRSQSQLGIFEPSFHKTKVPLSQILSKKSGCHKYNRECRATESSVECRRRRRKNMRALKYGIRQYIKKDGGTERKVINFYDVSVFHFLYMFLFIYLWVLRGRFFSSPPHSVFDSFRAKKKEFRRYPFVKWRRRSRRKKGKPVRCVWFWSECSKRKLPK